MSELHEEMTPVPDAESKTGEACKRCAGDDTAPHNHDVKAPAWITERAGKFLKARRSDVSGSLRP